MTASPQSGFPDHFSGIARAYARFRPGYPEALFDWLAAQSPAREAAWDCGCGSGQAAVPLAGRFARVIATDASAEQVAAATPHARVEYRVATAEASGLPDASVDLVTVAQALHWFRLDEFYAEARRVLRPRGVVAVWTYGVLRVEDAAAQVTVADFYRALAPHWPGARRHVEDGYRSLPFPFAELEAPEFELRAHWDVDALIGYIRTWSAVMRLLESGGAKELAAFETALRDASGSGHLSLHWPLALRAGALAD